MLVILYLSSQGKDASYYVKSLSKYVLDIHFTAFEKASRYAKRRKVTATMGTMSTGSTAITTHLALQTDGWTFESYHRVNTIKMSVPWE